jgi:hypothetical protein
VQVTGDPNEGFLDQVLGSVRISSFPNDEVHEPVSVPIVEVLEGSWTALEVGSHQFLVGKIGERWKVSQLVLINSDWLILPQLHLLHQFRVGHEGVLWSPGEC